ncbi:MAG: hypothetical protein HWN68_16285 [Desulfobacterales bacterium]|nr:hypothetical protein [Desulfobacterales bacterium]
MEENMKLKSIVLMLVMISALILATFNGGPLISQEFDPPLVTPPAGPFLKYGPRLDRVIFVVEAEEEELEAGLVDIVWPGPAVWDTWCDDPAITLGWVEEFAVIYLSLNTARWPLGHGDQPRAGETDFPTNWKGTHDDTLWKKDELWVEAITEDPYYEEDETTRPGRTGTADWCYVDYEGCQRCRDARQFRRGLAHLVNRDDQIASMAGEGQALDKSLLYEPLRSFWENPDTPTYEHSFVKANAAFVAGGFKDWDDDGVMEYSETRSSEDYEELPTIEWYANTEWDAAQHLTEVMSEYMGATLGLYECGAIPHTTIIVPYSEIDPTCWYYYDYDVYVEYWDWGATPDYYAEWFASFGDIFPRGYANNYARYHSKKFDQYADAFMTAPAPEDAITACYNMQWELHNDATAIPLYQYVGYVAHRTEYGTWPGEEKYAGRNWTDMCAFPGEPFFTFTGGWTHLNVHPQGFDKGGTLRTWVSSDPVTLDPADAWMFWDHQILSLIYDYLVRPDPWDPLNVTKMVPWLCESYEVGTWEHPTEGTCTAINFTLIPGILWQDGKPLTVDDVAFSFQFYKDVASIQYPKAKNFDSYVTYNTDPARPGDETIEIRYDIETWLAPAWCNGIYGLYILPKHIWSEESTYYCTVHEKWEQGPGAAGSIAYVPEDHDTLFGTGPFRFYKDGIVGRVDRVLGEYVYLEANPLYFRKYIWPDVADVGDPLNATAKDGEVDVYDFLVAALPGHIFAREDFYGQWSYPKPGDWGEPCDVNKDGRIGVGDLMEVGVNFAESWPPTWYLW